MKKNTINRRRSKEMRGEVGEKKKTKKKRKEGRKKGKERGKEKGGSQNLRVEKIREGESEEEMKKV